MERANQRAKDRKLDGRVDLMLGSATEMPFEAASFDKVTALESAFHFNTRDRFFDEAFRVLRHAAGSPLPTAVHGRASKPRAWSMNSS